MAAGRERYGDDNHFPLDPRGIATGLWSYGYPSLCDSVYKEIEIILPFHWGGFHLQVDPDDPVSGTPGKLPRLFPALLIAFWDQADNMFSV